MLRVKVCGITREADAWAAIHAGAHALGFITYAQSPRHIDPAAAAPWAARLPPFVTRVLVVVNPEPADLLRWHDVFPVDAWQFHGDESPGLVATAPPARRIKALRLTPETAGAPPHGYDVDAFLLDTPGRGYGGAGRPFDWTLAAKFKAACGLPVILAGGINAANVADAAAEVAPFAVDVNSGVESAPGQKDHAKLRDFLHLCQTL